MAEVEVAAVDSDIHKLSAFGILDILKKLVSTLLPASRLLPQPICIFSLTNPRPLRWKRRVRM